MTLRMSDSPCQGICELVPLGETKVCRGCGRDIAELPNWGERSPQERAEIRARAEARLVELGEQRRRPGDRPRRRRRGR